MPQLAKWQKVLKPSNISRPAAGPPWIVWGREFACQVELLDQPARLLAGCWRSARGGPGRPHGPYGLRAMSSRAIRRDRMPPRTFRLPGRGDQVPACPGIPGRHGPSCPHGNPIGYHVVGSATSVAFWDEWHCCGAYFRECFVEQQRRRRSAAAAAPSQDKGDHALRRLRPPALAAPG
jgi:hypothetical protein